MYKLLYVCNMAFLYLASSTIVILGNSGLNMFTGIRIPLLPVSILYSNNAFCLLLVFSLGTMMDHSLLKDLIVTMYIALFILLTSNINNDCGMLHDWFLLSLYLSIFLYFWLNFHKIVESG